MALTIKYGATGHAVRIAQRRLNVHGTKPPLEVTGKFDADTSVAVRRFQVRHSLVPDGIVGRHTWYKLWRRARRRVASPGPLAIFGIDVSNNNGVVDWDKVAKDRNKVGYAYAKVSEGSTFVDTQWKNNLKGASRNLIPIGGYMFAHPGTPQQGVKQADFFLSLLGDYKDQLPPVVDWEFVGVGSPAQIATLEAIVQRLKDVTGKLPIIYGGFYPLNAMGISPASIIAKCPLWIAAYPSIIGIPRPWKKATYHQFTSSASISGVAGRCDASHFLGGL